MPLASVILPTFNRAHVLLRAINSVLNQSFIDLELIVIDDCSKDNTADILRTVRDDRVKAIFLEENKGACFARNVGISAASGKYIAFQDSGDEWLFDKLSYQINILNNYPSYQATCASYFMIDESGKAQVVPDFLVSQKIIIVNDLLWGNLIDTPTLMVQKNILKKIGGFDEKLPRFQDWELGIRIAQETPILFTQSPLTIAHPCANSISKNNAARNKAHEYIINKHFNLFFSENKSLIANLNRLSVSYLMQSDPYNALKTIRKSLKYRPYSLETQLLFIYLILPINIGYKIEIFRNIRRLLFTLSKSLK